MITRRTFFSFFGVGVAALAKPDLFLSPIQKIVPVHVAWEPELPTGGSGFLYYVYLDENGKEVWAKFQDLAKLASRPGLIVSRDVDVSPARRPEGCEPPRTKLWQ